MKTLQNLIGGRWQDSRGEAFHEVIAGTLRGGREENTVPSPLVDERQRDIVERHAADAVERGATVPAGVVWVNQWQGGCPERLYEPAGDSGMGATGSRAAYDAATRPASVHTALAAGA